MSELDSVLRKLPSKNPTVSFSELEKIFAREHLFLEQWKTIDVDCDFVEKIVDIVQRYEANGLQLKGKGVRVLAKIFQYNKTPLLALPERSRLVLVEMLIRIGLEHSMVHFWCIELLQYAVDNLATSGSTVFEIGK